MKIRRSIALASLPLALLCGACSLAHGKEEAAQAVARFHAQYERQQFDSIYIASDKAMQQAMTRDQFIRFMTGVHRKLGHLEETHPAGWNVQARPGGSFVVLTYETDFERGPATETFTWRISGGTPQLQGYNVNSAALVTE